MNYSLSELIIQYQKKTNKNDAQFAFESHFPVEKIHAIKTGKISYTPDEEKRIIRYISEHR
ncbi:LBP_cg2779 family protein [Bombilactobacillus thymidiniphilus]|uniref:LBP_cg2779 family protein n=1 Tax=Bombilactobacillus thymidiniphilus TaxID=2923363 RepID=A0ABY4PCX7_9LACO|nr:LBP_cg2779 family protein [Bombilactobacillus thymidiniphilus]UQS83552.1 LBP_cg2779 family protein [Bombilactobacillus thymidiniphilus]